MGAKCRMGWAFFPLMTGEELGEMRRNFVGCRKSSAVLYRNNLKIWFKDRYYCSSFKGMKDSTFE